MLLCLGCPDQDRHFGLVVDDRDAVRTALVQAGVEIDSGRGLSFRDPSGNHVEIVQYDEIQFSKTPGVLHGMNIQTLEKTSTAREELRRKGLGDIEKP